MKRKLKQIAIGSVSVLVISLPIALIVAVNNFIEQSNLKNLDQNFDSQANTILNLH